MDFLNILEAIFWTCGAIVSSTADAGSPGNCRSTASRARSDPPFGDLKNYHFTLASCYHAILLKHTSLHLLIHNLDTYPSSEEK